jgi:hypothetical protein
MRAVPKRLDYHLFISPPPPSLSIQIKSIQNGR